jgi:hypothetical protein
MTRSRPKTVTVGPWTFTVDSSPKATLELADDGDYGHTEVHSLSMKIRGDLAEDVWWETLLHETMHAAWQQTPLAQMFTSEQEEQVIRGLAPFLFPLLGRTSDSQVD